MKKKKEPFVRKVHLCIPRAFGAVDILIFKEGSEELEIMLEELEAEGRGFAIAEQVIECLGLMTDDEARAKGLNVDGQAGQDATLS